MQICTALQQSALIATSEELEKAFNAIHWIARLSRNGLGRQLPSKKVMRTLEGLVYGNATQDETPCDDKAKVRTLAYFTHRKRNSG